MSTDKVDMHRHLVIMAGGVGSRLWPLSSEEKPKQFVDVLSCGRSLLQMTMDRLKGIVPPGNVWVVTGKKYGALVREQLPELPEGNILLEPMRRSTAPCIAYASWKIKSRDPRAIVVVTPSDHSIRDVKAYRQAINDAMDMASEGDAIVTLGIEPTHPCTAYGYIRVDRSSPSARHERIFAVDSFHEKPDEETAKEMLREGGYVWNAGIFVWNVGTIVNALRIYAPDIDEQFEPLLKVYGTAAEQNRVDKAFENSPSISIDYAVMEKAEEIYCLPANCGWSDLGSWDSLAEERAARGLRTLKGEAEQPK